MNLNIETNRRDDYIMLVSHGAIMNDAENMILASRYMEIMDKYGVKNVLINELDLIIPNGVIDQVTLSTNINENHIYKNLIKYTIAIISSSRNLGAMKFFCSYMQNLGYNYEAFADEAEALKWLSEN